MPGFPTPAFGALALSLSTLLVSAAAAAPRMQRHQPRKPAAARPAKPARVARPTEVLDVQNTRVVPVEKYPNEIPTCDVLVIGGGLGGVAAAEALAKTGRTVILTEPTSALGGQLTSQGVACPDENQYIEKEPGVSTRSYREVRTALRDKYAATEGIKAGRAQNPGSCWVSRLSGEPAVWEEVLKERLKPWMGVAGIRRILTRNELIWVHQFPGSGRYHYADFVNLDTGRITRVAAQYMLDATEFGDGIAKAGCPWTVGQDAQSAYNEKDAPTAPHPDWIQSLTYCFAVRWQPEGPCKLAEKPAEYEYFKSLGEYTLAYDYSDARGRVFYQVFKTAPKAAGPFWTYRRLIAAANWNGNPKYAQDLALINWRGNDFHLENPIGKPLAEQARILKRAKAFAQGFLYWLQNECPRDDGSGVGYPEMQLDTAAMLSADGFSLHPYVRESRRLQAQFTLNENHLQPDPNNPDKKWGEEFADTVGTALYAMDIHPAQGEPPFLSRALPYHLPLGSFIGKSGPANVIPANKNFGASRLALASARMHPTEWLVGEVAGHLASFCLGEHVDPAEVRNRPELLQRFQAELHEAGVTLRWSEVIK